MPIIGIGFNRFGFLFKGAIVEFLLCTLLFRLVTFSRTSVPFLLFSPLFSSTASVSFLAFRSIGIPGPTRSNFSSDLLICFFLLSTTPITLLHHLFVLLILCVFLILFLFVVVCAFFLLFLVFLRCHFRFVLRQQRLVLFPHFRFQLFYEYRSGVYLLLHDRHLALRLVFVDHISSQEARFQLEALLGVANIILQTDPQLRSFLLARVLAPYQLVRAVTAVTDPVVHKHT
mmetsp:Transcript_15539/g.29906  ORF Transcript_15539/g.29906 Transcript_15539/m.29906 type:complete len:230 (+) Transcript_15539:1113-1802(+)